MESTNKRLKLCKEGVKTRSATRLNINCLPDEVFIEIFRHLDFKQQCRNGRVCKKWYEVSRSPVFWKTIVINIPRQCSSMSRAALNLVGSLSSCVVYMELRFEDSPDDWFLDIVEFSHSIRTRCPSLRALILHNIGLVPLYCTEETLDVCKQLPDSIRVLVLRQSQLIGGLVFKSMDSNKSKIEVLDLSRCDETFIRPYIFSRFPHLKKLRLTGCKLKDHLLESSMLRIVNKLEVLDLEDTLAESATFRAIRVNGFHLTELYVCNTYVSNGDLIFINSQTALKNLKIICLRSCSVKRAGIMSLLQSCPSLHHVYVGSFQNSTSDDYSEIYSEKVNVVWGIKYCDHSNKVDYTLE